MEGANRHGNKSDAKKRSKNPNPMDQLMTFIWEGDVFDLLIKILSRLKRVSDIPMDTSLPLRI